MKNPLSKRLEQMMNTLSIRALTVITIIVAIHVGDSSRAVAACSGSITLTATAYPSLSGTVSATLNGVTASVRALIEIKLPSCVGAIRSSIRREICPEIVSIHSSEFS